MEKIVSYCKDWFEKYQPEGSLIEQVLWIFWAVWILLILIAVYRVIKFRVSLGKEFKIWGDGSGSQRSAVVIVPIKGVTPRHTSDFFQSLLEQNYSKYRIIVAVETSDDPAAEWLFDQFDISLSNPVWAPEKTGSGLQSLQFVVAGKCKGRGQKVHNQLAAFEQLSPEDEIIAFVDADILCPVDWLAKLTAPINRRTHDPATTYRWLVPAKTRIPNLFASVINASVTTQGGNVRENMPWGGSMAISRGAFEDINVPLLLQGSLNDDLRLGKAAKKAGYKVGYIRNLVRPTEINFTWGQFLEFSRRQYFQARVFAPILYFCANVIFAIYFWGFVSIVAAIVTGYLWAWVPLIIATVLDQVRAATRESIYRHLFGDNREIYKRIAKTSMVEQLMTPLYMSLHGLIIVSTWFMNKVEWGGIQYQVKGVDKTRVLRRNPVKQSVSLSSVGELALPVGGVFTALNAIGAGNFSPSEKVAENTSDGGVSKSAVTLADTAPISLADREAAFEKVAELEVLKSEVSGGDVSGNSEPNEFSKVSVAENDISGGMAIPPGACEFTVFDVIDDLVPVESGGGVALGSGGDIFNDTADGSWADFEEGGNPEAVKLAESEEVEPGGEKFFTFQKLGNEEIEGAGLATAAVVAGLVAEEVVAEEVAAEEVVAEEVVAEEVAAEEVGKPAALITGIAAGSGVGSKMAAESKIPASNEVSNGELASVSVSAVPGVASAVALMGKEGALSLRTRFRPLGIAAMKRSKNSPAGKIYLARMEKMTRQQIGRLKRAKR